MDFEKYMNMTKAIYSKPRNGIEFYVLSTHPDSSNFPEEKPEGTKPEKPPLDSFLWCNQKPPDSDGMNQRSRTLKIVPVYEDDFLSVVKLFLKKSKKTKVPSKYPVSLELLMIDSQKDLSMPSDEDILEVFI